MYSKKYKSKDYTKKSEQKSKIFEAPRLYTYAIWLLSRKDYSAHEMEQKMKKYQPDLSIIEQTIKKLIDYGYINNERRASNLIQVYSKKESSYKVKQRLAQKGIDKETIQNTLEQMGVKDSEQDTAYGLLVKKFKHFDVELKQKYCAFLANKGYGWDIISKSIDKFKQEYFVSVDDSSEEN